MKSFGYLIVSLLICLNISAQKLQLKITAASENERKIIDSINYNNKHNNLKSIIEEAKILSKKLTQAGYIENQVIGTSQTSDSTFVSNFDIGKQTKFIHVYIGNKLDLILLSILNFKSDTAVIAFPEVESFMNQALNKLEKNGYSLSNLKLIDFEKKNATLYAQLKIETGNKRKLNDIIIVGYDKFPEGHKKNIKRFYKNKTFNLENLKKLNADFNKFRFVSQKKYPEILFTKDTTKVYVYLEKSKPNRFDGLIGFSNDDKSNLRFNGYLDLLLVNILNSGEALSLYWKSDGNNQKTFNIDLELPYVFKSRFGLKTNLNIFKQDSTFQNTKTAIDLGYFFDYNTRVYIGYQATTSSDIQNRNNFSLSDYKNSFTTLTFDFLKLNTQNEDNILFPEKTKINLETGLGSRNSKTNTNKQLFINLNASHKFKINNKNSFNLKSQNFYLQSDTYIISELYRFGGINSIRGFNENSLQANFFTSLLAEYRYNLGQTIYVHTITDYGYLQDTTSNNNEKLLGLGFGFGILTKNGLLNLVYANGSTKNQAITLANSIVHLSFKTNF